MAAEAITIPQVLVTGASGFIATHIIQQLLTGGQVKVRGTVRSLKNEAKVKPLQDLVPDATYPLELVEADLLNEESWKEAVKGCTHVYHVASPLPSSAPQDENQLIRPAVEGTLNVLKACVKAGTVKRVVLTSSLAAISGGLYGVEGHIYTENDWRAENGLPAYEKSKIRAEKEAWYFLDKLEDDKKFELITVQPSVVIGPPLTVATTESTSLSSVKKIISNEIPVLLNINLPLVDVRDVAKAQIAAMEKSGTTGDRFIITAENRSMREMAEVMSREFGPQGYKIPLWSIPKPGVWLLSFFEPTVRMIYSTIGKTITFSNERMKEELGIQPRNVETTIIDACYALIELGVVPKRRGYRGPPAVRTDTSVMESEPLESVSNNVQVREGGPLTSGSNNATKEDIEKRPLQSGSNNISKQDVGEGPLQSGSNDFPKEKISMETTIEDTETTEVTEEHIEVHDTDINQEPTSD